MTAAWIFPVLLLDLVSGSPTPVRTPNEVHWNQNCDAPPLRDDGERREYLPPCASHALQMEAWRSALEVYRDPSAKRRSAVTRRLMDMALVQFRAPEVLASEYGPDFVCLRQFEFIDPEVEAKALGEKVEVYRKERDRLGAGAASDALRALTVAENRAVEEVRFLRGRIARLQRARPTLPETDLLAGGCATLKEDATSVRYMIQGKPTLLERLDATLSLIDTGCPLPDVPGHPGFPDLLRGFGCMRGIDVNYNARAWAIEQITAARDPRDWEPVEVAHLLWAARRAGWVSGVGFPSTHRGLVRALKPMGVLRTRELLALPPETENGVLGAPTPENDPHFAGEATFYGAEWYESHPTAAPQDTLSDRYQFERTASVKQYVGERWLETDNAAPHPDLAIVRAELKRLEEGSKK